MAQPKLNTPTYRLLQRDKRWYVRWWESGAWQRVSTGTDSRAEAQLSLAPFIAGRGTPPPLKASTISAILDAYLQDRQPAVVSAGYLTLQNAVKPPNRHLGDLQPDHLTKERTRFYRRQRAAERYEVCKANARRKKPVQDGTILRELVTLRAALRFAQTEKWIEDVPYVDVRAQPKPRDRWLSRSDADRLIAQAQALHVKTFLAVCFYAAARAGSVLQPTWDRIDLAAGMIDFSSVAGGKGRAVVPIAKSLMHYLEQAREAATSPFVIEHGS